MGLLKKIADYCMGEAEPAPVRNLGRNDACWCGSGMKYKKCHLHVDEKKAQKYSRINCGTT